MRQSAVQPEEAEAIAIKALGFLAKDPELLSRFLSMSGLEPTQLRQAAESPSFFAGLLDFLLAHEPTLLAFTQSADLSPEAVVQAREVLGRNFAAGPR